MKMLLPLPVVARAISNQEEYLRVPLQEYCNQKGEDEQPGSCMPIFQLPFGNENLVGG
jgi:hypothetical protein